MASSKTDQQTVLIVAGGTGGHIYPGLALAKALQITKPDWRIEFVGTPHGLENQIIPKENFKVNHISIGRLNSNVSIKERLLTVLKMPFALLQSLKVVISKKPAAVIGVGGHASGPVLLMASLLGRNTFIWEPNAYPGLANRILSKFVKQGWVVFEETNRILKMSNVHQVGMPVRKEIEQVGNKPAVTHPKLNVLVFGGSQGARGLNTVIADFLTKTDADVLQRIQVVHQTGAADIERVKALYQNSNAAVEVLPYLHDMQNRYAWADLIIARSGTGTLSELAACAKPSILVPLATAADNHQQKNAEVFVRAGAAEMILQKDLTTDVVKNRIVNYLEHPEQLIKMSKAAHNLHKPNAAEYIVKHLLEQINSH